MSGSVLVVDDQRLPRQALANELRDAGFKVAEASDGAEGWLSFCRHPPDVVVTDLVMPICGGLDLLQHIQSQSDVPVILFSSQGTVETAAAAFKAGASDFLSATDLSGEGIVDRVTRLIGTRGYGDEDPRMQRYFVGRSPPMIRLRAQLTALAPLLSPVFILGDSGTGRDTAVRALHETGSSAGGRLVKIRSHTQVPDLSNGFPGAFYLDGFETFSGSLQREWLNRIGDARRSGYARTRRIFISSRRPRAAWLDDPTFIEGPGGFLLSMAVSLQPLSSHREDLPDIAKDLCKRISASLGRRVRLSPASLRYISDHQWNGEIRELKQVLERVVAFTAGEQVRRDTLKDVFRESIESVESYRQLRLERERSDLIEALRKFDGNISRTAHHLNRSRAAIYRMIKKFKIPLRPGT
ncbi:MAG: response regulator [Myxococcota bacterium]|nr:response regulator [Myxococcota bacterium]